MLPLTVAVADCVPVIIEGTGAVGIAHAGWRGAAAGVVAATVAALDKLKAAPLRAAVGPGIGPCCFEVGSEVAERFPGHVGSTTWGTTSVDLVGVVRAQLGEIPLWVSTECTYCGSGNHSYRRDRTKQRQVAVAWIPSD
jgi:copper oxidase (laccase) domain-containing protein